MRRHRGRPLPAGHGRQRDVVAVSSFYELVVLEKESVERARGAPAELAIRRQRLGRRRAAHDRSALGPNEQDGDQLGKVKHEKVDRLKFARLTRNISIIIFL